MYIYNVVHVCTKYCMSLLYTCTMYTCLCHSDSVLPDSLQPADANQIGLVVDQLLSY